LTAFKIPKPVQIGDLKSVEKELGQGQMLVANGQEVLEALERQPMT
jgi:hypothetical protein